jgi:hypothetical protein
LVMGFATAKRIRQSQEGLRHETPWPALVAAVIA